MSRSNIPFRSTNRALRKTGFMYMRLLVSFLVLIFLGVATVRAQTSAPEIGFTVSMSKPHTHLFEVDVQIKRGPNASVPAEEFLIMPVWTPGSYLVREFERHVQDFSVKDAAGNTLKWEKVNKNKWK